MRRSLAAGPAARTPALVPLRGAGELARAVQPVGVRAPVTAPALRSAVSAPTLPAVARAARHGGPPAGPSPVGVRTATAPPRTGASTRGTSRHDGSPSRTARSVGATALAGTGAVRRLTVLPPRTVVRRGTAAPTLAPAGVAASSAVTSAPPAPRHALGGTPGTPSAAPGQGPGAGVVRRWLPPTGLERTPVHDEVRPPHADVERRLRAELTSWLEHELDDRVVRIVEERLQEQDERRTWRRTREVFS
ncbi:hypothetical protein [Cellulomonas wangsupingiae]|uniref:Uncharacterized protein n=1 Tax=Cellulomonas wangsupingiae TaxID=2968085 RepID=A0ABY5K6G7_9CELL|nr:hypothetical protein [Cellulomonas wangsupingiae]MCC2336477.1 hypothetical protein [Cellulomonas wangsupingiae]UUI64645.1 hypothetical protein NP075_16225 [Cellulomonas wangsupingiae]